MRRVERTVVVTRRSLILPIWGLVIFIFLYQDTGIGSMGWRRYVSSCLSCWRFAGLGRPPGTGRVRPAAPSASPATCGPIWCRASTSGCAAHCSAGSSPPAARTTPGSGSR